MLAPLLLGALLSAPIPTYNLSQGQTAILSVPGCRTMRIEIFGRGYECRQDDTVVVGVDFLRQPGSYPIIGRQFQNETEVGVIAVLPQSFKTEHWSFRPGKPGDSRKRAGERERIAHALMAGEQKYPHLRLADGAEYPLERVEVNSDFGIKRIYRHRRTKKTIKVDYHRGVDLDTGRVNQPVRAVAPGVVVVAERFSVEGNMVIMYHGSGVYTLYLHLSSLAVHEGQNVRDVRQLLGLSGNTGASSGPHLHFAAKVNGATVDPLQLVELFK